MSTHSFQQMLLAARERFHVFGWHFYMLNTGINSGLLTTLFGYP